ncbi:DUF3572 domain-containing protein [Phaeovulum sp.]|uniref:DUF3572 domain-containing protein n=1 Tax=Phaeovulum sp. TaxID=2934796 RepID=UPI00272F960A|nr:DUF3572 domain-containing protein [Phaeovulum sp.]MDP1667430.1 DUF3572 domain-containing protein [Phaeovulum sp.]MDP2064323.1 DUF3572 domain-containing protein [Phaeovulum sp.]MDP3861092.1 DUF3572 domain-containing protein [Phaeovulum sp.]MDZ4119947.1 DUF3572 domain-containing protein [Phaeovulum sp.]
MNRNFAETVGLQALGWIAARDDLFEAFLAASGAAVADLRSRAADPAFLAAVLDFLLQSDATVLEFADEAGLAPEAAMQAADVLAGGAAAHWT